VSFVFDFNVVDAEQVHPFSCLRPTLSKVDACSDVSVSLHLQLEPDMWRTKTPEVEALRPQAMSPTVKQAVKADGKLLHHVSPVQ
jgi:hypothetical protein